MTATRQDILDWLKEAKKTKAEFLIVGHDPFDHENFPIYCKDAAECNGSLKRLIRDGNSYDEVYDMSLSIEEQLAERRSMHIPK